MAVIGPLLENGISPHILLEYDIKIKNAKIINNVIKIESDYGAYAIKGTKININQMKKTIEITQFLNYHGINTSTIIKNKFGEYYINHRNKLIYVTEWLDGSNIKLNYNPHYTAFITEIAKMHKTGFSFTPKENYINFDENYIRNTWEGAINWLKVYKKQLKRKTTKSTFEHIYLNYLPFLIDWAEETLEYYSQWLLENNDLRKTICHGKLHHRNAIITKNNKLYIIDFEYANINTPVRDIAYFIKRYIMNKENRTWANTWLSTYQKILPLNKVEKNLLAIYLLFPDRLISIAKKYTKNNNFSDDYYLRNLHLRWEQQKELIWFVDQNRLLNK